MQTIENKILALDISIFDAIPSQSSEGCRIAFLAIQRATRQRNKTFSYLEIGSHLGGTIQPYYLDDSCIKIYSIDPRPSEQPDDRKPGYIAYYENNSSARMMGLLQQLNGGIAEKVECFDTDVNGMKTEDILVAPEVILIDGEHTKKAVLGDFAFCERVASNTCTILFHDFDYIYPAIDEICKKLKKNKSNFIPLKLDGGVFAIFFDKRYILSDSYLTSMYNKKKHFFWKFLLKEKIRSKLPPALLNIKRRFFYF